LNTTQRSGRQPPCLCSTSGCGMRNHTSCLRQYRKWRRPNGQRSRHFCKTLDMLSPRIDLLRWPRDCQLRIVATCTNIISWSLRSYYCEYYCNDNYFLF